jgi:gamma-glutamyltranspeptidase/glutathione hydrolase
MVLLSILNWTNGGTANEMTSIKRFHHQYLPDKIQYEKDAFSEPVIDELIGMGHKLQEIRDYGNMQVITIQKDNGKVEISSDPRALIEDSGIDYY